MLVAQQEKLNKVGVVLIARQTSSRLPSKVLLKINGKVLIEIILEKVLQNTDEYIFAIPDNYENSDLKEFLVSNDYRFYAGSETNVLERFLEASKRLKSTYIQRLNCDNLLFDPSYMKKCYDSIDDDFDIFTNVNCENHSGTSVEIIRKEKCAITGNPSHYEREHIFPYFYINRELKRLDLECPFHKVFPIDTKSEYLEAVKLLE
jgi:spore coat polysaccharide biosynthesis protein SpsF